MEKKKSGARQRILDSAIELFATKGYKATTTREIVSLAKSSLSMLDLHFGTKQALYKEVIEQIIHIYIMDTLPLFGEIVEYRTENHIEQKRVWQYIEQMVDMHLNIVTNPDNKQLIMVLNRELQEKEEIDINLEPVFMYIYNFQLLFEDYVGCEHGQWWARVLSFDIVTTMFSLLTYPKVLNPFQVTHEFMVEKELSEQEVISEIKDIILCTIKANLDTRMK